MQNLKKSYLKHIDFRSIYNLKIIFSYKREGKMGKKIRMENIQNEKVYL